MARGQTLSMRAPTHSKLQMTWKAAAVRPSETRQTLFEAPRLQTGSKPNRRQPTRTRSAPQRSARQRKGLQWALLATAFCRPIPSSHRLARAVVISPSMLLTTSRAPSRLSLPTPLRTPAEALLRAATRGGSSSSSSRPPLRLPRLLHPHQRLLREIPASTFAARRRRPTKRGPAAAGKHTHSPWHRKPWRAPSSPRRRRPTAPVQSMPQKARPRAGRRVPTSGRLLITAAQRSSIDRP
mmetsp:Transcript_19134/g.45628  ORF Transcript_19134/g.45628 Transcript_19134/m.45628 type:complete len:239 (-) Transcript_19134:274-990(-)